MYLFVVEEDLSLTDKIYLASLLRVCLHEEAEYIEKINQKDITIIKIYACNIGTAKYIKQT